MFVNKVQDLVRMFKVHNTVSPITARCEKKCDKQHIGIIKRKGVVYMADKEFLCEVCGMDFDTQEELDAHKLRMHAEETEEE